MFERFTAIAIKVVMLAQEEARRLKHNFVGTEQLLLGLIGEGSGVASMTLRSYGVTLKESRIEVENLIGMGGDSMAVEIPFTPRAKRMLEFSWKHAKALGDSYICTEHLLMGLLDAGDDGVAMKVLNKLSPAFLESSFAEQMHYFKRELAEPNLGYWDLLFSFFPGKAKEVKNLSSTARAVIDAAENEARSAGYLYAGSDQLLLALLQAKDSYAAQVLSESGATEDMVCEKMDKHRAAKGLDGSVRIKLTPRVKRIIALAQRESKLEKRKTIDAEDLLAALLSEEEGVGVQLVMELGVDRIQLHSRVRRRQGC